MWHIVRDTVARIPADNRRLRVQTAMSLITTSPQYQVQRSKERHMALTRREFVCRSFASFGAAVWAFERFGLLQALAQAGDYKALVCIFLFGGNDSGNMIIPYDDYATYAAVW